MRGKQVGMHYINMIKDTVLLLTKQDNVLVSKLNGMLKFFLCSDDQYFTLTEDNHFFLLVVNLECG